MRVAILGNSGSGKSTLARQLAGRHGLATLDLDTLAWEPGKIAVPRPADAAAADVRAFCHGHARWVLEGCYADLIRVALADSPALLFLDPGEEACVANCRARPWEPHKYASRAEQDERLEALVAWVREYPERAGELGRAAHVRLFEDYAGAKEHLTGRPAPAYRPPDS